ncbi:MAG: TIGR00266 family protein [Clostridiales bacterium]|jgi:uncharacterized protein (TIGR00266 family)|nr:TIGR00266 family protein [Clostridiales bacterium]
MQYEIIGGNFPVVVCTLSSGETVISEKGGMSWMSRGIDMKTSTGGGIMKGLARTFSGESMFLNYYTANSAGQKIAFGSSYAGRVLDIRIEPGKDIIAQKSSMLVMEENVDIKTHFRKKIGAGFFGGEGFILQRFSGNGMAFLEIDGEIQEYNLSSGEELVIDQGYLAAMESTVSFDIERVKGLKNIMFGGEGLFVGLLKGPGKVWLQTMPISNLANAIISKIPSGS